MFQSIMICYGRLIWPWSSKNAHNIKLSPPCLTKNIMLFSQLSAILPFESFAFFHYSSLMLQLKYNLDDTFWHVLKCLLFFYVSVFKMRRLCSSRLCKWVPPINDKRGLGGLVSYIKNKEDLYCFSELAVVFTLAFLTSYWSPETWPLLRWGRMKLLGCFLWPLLDESSLLDSFCKVDHSRNVPHCSTRASPFVDLAYIFSMHFGYFL